MFALRCTRQLLRRIGPPASPEGPSTTRLGDWFANLLSMGPQRFILLVSERTRLPVLVRARDVKRLREHLVEALPPVLRALTIPDGDIQRELAEMRDVVIAPTNNRSVVGTLTDFAFAIKFSARQGTVTDLTAVAIWLSETPILPLDSFPDRLTREAFGDDPPREPARATSTRVYRLSVTLIDSKPPIWRRVEVPASISLATLHDVLQAAMGWTNSHLHDFEKDGVTYGQSDREFGVVRVNEKRTRLSDVLTRAKASLDYQYDFGDSWLHRVVLEEITEGDGRAARVLDGRRACPPEDCGGIWGYASLLESLANPRSREHKELREWAGDYDPDVFDLEAANRRLARLRF